MSSRKLENIAWYNDSVAEAKGEPGIYHSFIKAWQLRYFTTKESSILSG